MPRPSNSRKKASGSAKAAKAAKASGASRASRKRGVSAKRSASRKAIDFLQKPSCTTCQKARTFMQRRGFKMRFRDLEKSRLSVTELEDLIGPREHAEFLNPRSRSYEESGLGEEPTRREAIRAMAKQPNLIRRPIIVAGGRVVVGFDKNGIMKL